MRRLIPVLVLLFAVALPASAQALSLAEARHFAQRTGFAAMPDEVLRLLPMTRDQAIADVLKNARTEPVTAAPSWANETADLRVPKGDAAEKREFLRQRRLETLELRAWWYREMLATPSPLTERMTLFWHNHFATSVRKVRSAALMYRQNQLLRRNAVGSFKAMLTAIPRDPAMVRWLDSATNRKDKPNENFARELLELFTLGEGQIYTEQDIKEAARAFTGWNLDRQTGEYRFRRAAHDNGEKAFLGKRGAFGGDEIVAILLEHPRPSVFIVEKLWREFVSETPDAAEVQRIAARFKASDYDMKVALGALFATPAFWAEENRGRLVRSPVEMVVGTMRLLGIEPLDGQTMFNIGNALGQDVFAPPNVKGWPGGTAWIASNTLIARRQLLDRMARPRLAVATPPPPKADPKADDDATMAEDDDKSMDNKPATKSKRADMQPKPKAKADRSLREMRALQSMPGGNVEAWVERLPAPLKSAEAVTLLLLPTTPVNKPRGPADDMSDNMADPARFVRALLLDPAYQLK